MNESLPSSIIKPKTKSIVWRLLLPNVRCMQVPLTEVASVLDLYTFDIMSLGGGKLGDGYKILPENYTYKSRIREGDVKAITLNGCHKDKCNWKGHIVVLLNKLLNFCNIECSGDHDPDHIWQKSHRMATSVRKTISSRATNTTPSVMATEFMNNAKILNINPSTPANHVQPIFTQFAPNLEAIQNALKYDKKLHYPSALEFEKVCSIMDTYEKEHVVISKQYGIKDADNSKDQAVLLGIASTIMPELLSKYPDFLAVNSTSRRNDLNFPNTAFMIRSDEPRGRIVATFISDKETIPVVSLMFEQAATGVISLATAETIISYFRVYWFGDWIDYKRDSCPMKTNMLLESYFKKDMILHYRERNTKSLHSNLEKIGTSMCVDAGEMERFWKGEGKPPTKSDLQRKKEKINEQGELLYKKNLVQEIDQNTWHVTQFTTTDLEDDVVNKENKPESNENNEKQLCVMRKNGKFACSCSFNVISGHECQDVVAVHLFIGKSKLRNKNDKPVAKLAACSSLESYLHQKDANDCAQNELKLLQKKGPKNKRKNRLISGEFIQLQDTVLSKPYHKVQIAEIIGDSKIIANITLESGDMKQRTIQLADIARYIDGPLKKNK
ncbi:12250_t:CDS:2, partial [Ambispora gerdemannii]